MLIGSACERHLPFPHLYTLKVWLESRQGGGVTRAVVATRKLGNLYSWLPDFDPWVTM